MSSNSQPDVSSHTEKTPDNLAYLELLLRMVEQKRRQLGFRKSKTETQIEKVGREINSVECPKTILEQNFELKIIKYISSS